MREEEKVGAGEVCLGHEQHVGPEEYPKCLNELYKRALLTCIISKGSYTVLKESPLCLEN